MPAVHLVDATYELFRAWFAVPSSKARDGREVGAVRGLLSTLLALVQREGATHVGCATDSVIRSFRNDLYPHYKTEEGVDPALLAQFPLAEEAIGALGMVVWPMIELEADDALATAAARYRAAGAGQVLIATVDKDLAQCVDGDRVVVLDRRRERVIDEAAVRSRYGIAPQAMPDWLALVGDAADGYPGIPGFGERTASALLAAHGRIEEIPDDAALWKATVRGAARLAATLAARRDEARLYKTLATLRTDAPVKESIDELEWRGASPELRPFCERIGFEDFPRRVTRWRGA